NNSNYIYENCDNAAAVKNAIITQKDNKYKMNFINNAKIESMDEEFTDLRDIEKDLIEVTNKDQKKGIINLETKKFELKPVFNSIKLIGQLGEERYYLIEYKGLFGVSKRDNNVFINAVHENKKQALDAFKVKISKHQSKEKETKKDKDLSR
ncbi:MAG: hypothetical protein MJA82_14910, partial [Clostridia bacterium]|nr:hypothetical protein [Clostridia bacterium]